MRASATLPAQLQQQNRFAKTGSVLVGIDMRALLARLEVSCTPTDMDFPGLRLHLLKGGLARFYAVDVSGNWQLIFRFDEHGKAADVDLVDYH